MNRPRTTVTGFPSLVTTHGSVVTVGTFDGVHLGHQDVLRRLVALAESRGLPSLLVTFAQHPLEVINSAVAPPLLTTHEEKLEILSQTGLRYAASIPFTPTLAALDAADFVSKVLIGEYRMTELLVGYDHGFGRGRMGDASVLLRLGEQHGFGVTVLPPVHSDGGGGISSTVIRRAVAAGEMRKAMHGLGRPFPLSGVVESGDRRGRLLGFPTLNIAAPGGRKLLPPDGVYAVRVQANGGPFGGMMNLGGRPTFGDEGRRLEVHLFDADGDWYGQKVRVDVIERLREVRAFPDVDALKGQLAMDEGSAREALASLP